MSADEFMVCVVMGTAFLMFVGFALLVLWALYKAIKEM
jgi:hypothetical protein